MSLGRAAYECDWTGVHDYKLRMGLIMIMTQASRKIELTVGGFMILCMESFAAVSISFIFFYGKKMLIPLLTYFNLCFSLYERLSHF